MAPPEYAKRDLILRYGGRPFAVRAYRDDAIAAGPPQRALILEHRAAPAEEEEKRPHPDTNPPAAR